MTKKLLTIFMLAGLFCQPNVQAQLTILSGPERGSYYAFVNDMATLAGQSIVNKPTGGSAYNFKMLANPSSEFKVALIQSDYLQLMMGEDRLNNTFKTKPLEVVMELASEEVHLITLKSSGLKTMTDLEGKKVAIGTEEQGSFATAKMMASRSKIGWSPYNIEFENILSKLAEGYIDAGVLVGSAPLSLLNIDPQVMVNPLSLIAIDNQAAWASFYEADTIEKGAYPWLDTNIPTISVRTLLVVNQSKLTDADKVALANLKAGLAKNLNTLKSKGHPQWKTVLEPDDANEMPAAATNQVNPAPAQNTPNEVVYRVQIFSRSYKTANQPVTINGAAYSPFVYFYKEAWRYTVGEFNTLTDAMAFQDQCRQSGYNQAFVAAFVNGQRSNNPDLFKH